MWRLDHFDELRVLRVVDVRTEGNVVDGELALNRGPFHRDDFVRFGHDFLKSPVGNNSYEKSSRADGKIPEERAFQIGLGSGSEREMSRLTWI